jgi:hypothetical protein
MEVSRWVEMGDDGWWWEELDGCALRWIRRCRGYDVGKTSWKKVSLLRLPGT